MDQTASQNQGVLRHQRERSEDPNLDRWSMYVLVAIARKRLDLEASLHQTPQILSVNLFEKTPISQGLQPLDMEANLLSYPNQLILFDL